MARAIEAVRPARDLPRAVELKILRLWDRQKPRLRAAGKDPWRAWVLYELRLARLFRLGLGIRDILRTGLDDVRLSQEDFELLLKDYLKKRENSSAVV